MLYTHYCATRTHTRKICSVEAVLQGDVLYGCELRQEIPFLKDCDTLDRKRPAVDPFLPSQFFTDSGRGFSAASTMGAESRISLSCCSSHLRSLSRLFSHTACSSLLQISDEHTRRRRRSDRGCWRSFGSRSLAQILPVFCFTKYRFFFLDCLHYSHLLAYTSGFSITSDLQVTHSGCVHANLRSMLKKPLRRACQLKIAQ